MTALRKVLVVDDDAIVGKSFHRVLSETKGYVVTTAENAHEALRQMSEKSFDMVFTDIKMPGMDGVELAARVKASQPWVPVVIITGYGTKAEEARAKAVGIAEFVRKPLSPEMIERSAASALLQGAPAPAPAIAVAPAAAVVEMPAAPVAAEKVAARSQWVNVLLFLSSPFIGLLYAVLLPFVGLGMIAWAAGKAAHGSPALRSMAGHVKPFALLAAAPFIGLAYAVSLPFIGLGMLAWMGGKAGMRALSSMGAKAAAMLPRTQEDLA